MLVIHGSVSQYAGHDYYRFQKYVGGMLYFHCDFLLVVNIYRLFLIISRIIPPILSQDECELTFSSDIAGLVHFCHIRIVLCCDMHVIILDCGCVLESPDLR